MNDGYKTFEDSLSSDDFGLIICGKTGKLKGLFIPEGKEDEEVPQSIIDVCVEHFGIDPNEFEEGYTIH